MQLKTGLREYPHRVCKAIDSFIVVAVFAALAGCASKTPFTTFDRMPWAYYSNRVWLRVTGVGLATGQGKDLRSVSFSYSPSSGKSEEEAIAIQSFNMFSGRHAEHFLLRVLFGAGDSSVDPSERITGGKAFHIYTFTNKKGESNTVFFDGTMYHDLF
jgi:hypothetical protein